MKRPPVSDRPADDKAIMARILQVAKPPTVRKFSWQTKGETNEPS